jgi:hypothetical protein
MKDKFIIEITLKHQLSGTFKDNSKLNILKRWLSIVMMYTMAKQKPVEDRIYLGVTNEVGSFCL